METSPEEQLNQAFSYYPRLKKVKEFVDQHLADPIGLQDAARIASLEPKYFSKWFKSVTGVGFSVWVHDLRVERATQLLRRRDFTISVVSRTVGYSSTRTFLRAFRERTGKTPSQYKRAARPKR